MFIILNYDYDYGSGVTFPYYLLACIPILLHNSSCSQAASDLFGGGFLAGWINPISFRPL
jgi:hypothetical protein